MIITEIRERLTRDPFQPFLIRASSGKEYIIRNPALVVPMKTWVYIAHPNSDHSDTVPYLHIAGVESLTHGHAVRQRRRRRA